MSEEIYTPCVCGRDVTHPYCPAHKLRPEISRLQARLVEVEAERDRLKSTLGKEVQLQLKTTGELLDALGLLREAREALNGLWGNDTVGDEDLERRIDERLRDGET